MDLHPQPLSCTRSDALAAGSSYPDVQLTVTSGAGTFTNSASVSGGGEASAQTGNNSDTDTVTVAANLPPSVTLTKTVRNVTRGGSAGPPAWRSRARSSNTASRT